MQDQGEACFFVAVGEDNALQQRKPGTPTKRRTGSTPGVENKTRLGNQMKKSPPQKLELPEHLKERLASLPTRRSPENILKREAQVSAKRAAMLEAKVNAAKSLGEKGFEVRARKASFEGNVSFLPNSPLEKPFRVPASLLTKLTGLAKVGNLDLIEKMQADASERRVQFLNARIASCREHAKIVRLRCKNKQTVSRFTAIPSDLPDRLKERLSTFRQRTPDAILRRENLATINRKISLEATVFKLKSRDLLGEKVKDAKIQFSENQVDFSGISRTVSLPPRLAERIRKLTLDPQVLNAKVLERSAQAAKLHGDILARNVQKLHQHQEHVEILKQKKLTQSRFPNASELPFLPKRLVDRLSTYRVRTPAAIMRQEVLTAQRRSIHIMQVAQKASIHAEKVNRVKALKALMDENIILPTTSTFQFQPCKLPARIAAKLTQLSRREPELIMSQFDAVVERAENRLKNVQEKCKQHSSHVQIVKKTHQSVARFTEIPSFLPAKLQERLRTYHQRTPATILRQNENAVTRAKLSNDTKAFKAKTESFKASQAKLFKESAKKNDIHFFESNTTPVVLPPRLAKRMASLKPKWTTQSVLLKDDMAAIRRNARLDEVIARAKKHNDKDVKTKMVAKSHVKRFDTEKFVEYLPARLKERLSTFSRPSSEALLRKSQIADAKHKSTLLAVSQKAKDHGIVAQHVRTLKQLAVDNQIDYSGDATPVKLPTRLAERLKTFKIRTPQEILARSEHASQVRAESIKFIKKRNAKHAAIVANRMAAKNSERRFSPESYSTLPKKLQNRLSMFKRPTADSLLRKYELAYSRANLLKQSTIARSKAHSVHVANVVKTHHKFRDTMEILTKNSSIPVTLPSRLRLRLEQLSAKKRTPDQLLENEKQVHTRRTRTIADRSLKVADHLKHVSQIHQQKMSVPRFIEEEFSDILPARLKERLKTYRVPTDSAITNKSIRVQQRHDLLIAAKVSDASRHAEHVEKVKATKAEFAENIQYGQERQEEITLPVKLASILEDLKSKFHGHTPEKLLEKEAKAHERREVLLAKRVEVNHKRSEKVSSLLSTKRRVEEDSPKLDSEVPETD